MQIRQGDVFVEAVAVTRGHDWTPADERGRVILAYGEATGHCHEVVAVDPTTELPAAELFDAPDGTRYLLVDQPCQLVHQEHGTIALAPGAYKVTRQREYAPEANRYVLD